MAIKIERIRINRGGPLERDFQLRPAMINLIYGHNETGKTYIVESIIRLLFRTGRKSAVDWNLRKWDFAGNIAVSGLKQEPVNFTKTSKKLDDYWEGEDGLPPDLSRLLVVKAGETLLTHEEDGVGRDILKNCLSGEGLLDRIESRISATLKGAHVEKGQIVGPAMGDIKNRNEIKQDLTRENNLLREAEDGYVSGVAGELQRRKETIRIKLDMQEKARRYHAANLRKKQKELCQKKESLPEEEELSRIESDISVYENKKSEIAAKAKRLAELESAVESYQWVEQALNVYKEITGGRNVVQPRSLYMALALLFLGGTVVTGVLSLEVPLAICATGSLAFSILYFIKARNALSTASSSSELEKLKAEYRKRYDSELTDRALLEAQVEQLRDDYYRANSLKKEMEEELKPNLEMQEITIKRKMKELTGSEQSQEQWRPTVSNLRSKLKNINNEINLLERDLFSLGVSEQEQLDEDPGIAWDRQLYDRLNGKLNETKERLKEDLGKLDRLRNRVVQETNLESTDWEDLLAALRNKRDEKLEEYKHATAEILARIQVNAVIREFREEENARIKESLERAELTQPLYALTNRYRRIMHEEVEGLVLITDKDEEYRLAEISTGAREQIFLALRMGFSSISMKGQTAFLILDDAFQHSDWLRRPNLVDQVMKLAESGWQVFYFAMDDHIRDLFLKAGERAGDGFISHELH
jgi:hypothetical protein